MKIIVFLFAFSISHNLFSQPKVEVFSLKSGADINILANNEEYCPVSMVLDLNIENLASNKGSQKTFVIPAKSKNYILLTLQKINEFVGYNYSYNLTSIKGDITINEIDTNYQYDLPFLKNNSFQVQQGYFGRFTHQNERALDFTMPIGTKVSAARDGIVITLVQNNTQHCSNPRCIDFNNYIEILHSDGTIANYSHLKYKSSDLLLGDKVEQGEVIAESDETGFTSGPHLHFICYVADFNDKKTIPTLFKISDGKTATYLTEQNFYTKNY